MDRSSRSVGAITLFVADPRRSKEFYERIFGVAGIDEGHGTVIVPLGNLFLRLLERGEADREMLGEVAVGDPSAGAAVQVSFPVDDADAFCRELSEHGVPIVYGPVDRPWGVRNAAFADPDGHLWQISGPIPAAEG